MGRRRNDGKASGHAVRIGESRPGSRASQPRPVRAYGPTRPTRAAA